MRLEFTFSDSLGTPGHCMRVRVLAPDGTQVAPTFAPPSFFCKPARITMTALPQTGTYTIELDPQWTDIGRLSLAAVDAGTAPLPCRPSTVLPIVLVHGFGGATNDWDDFRPYLVARLEVEFRRDGYSAAQAAACAPMYLRAIPVGKRARGADNSLLVTREMVRISLQTGQSEVDVIAHSKGGLDSRAAAEVSLAHARNLVMIATPNGGTPMADFACGVYQAPDTGAIWQPIAPRHHR